jgi:hypothetical protein
METVILTAGIAYLKKMAFPEACAPRVVLVSVLTVTVCPSPSVRQTSSIPVSVFNDVIQHFSLQQVADLAIPVKVEIVQASHPIISVCASLAARRSR